MASPIERSNLSTRVFIQLYDGKMWFRLKIVFYIFAYKRIENKLGHDVFKISRRWSLLSTEMND